MTQCIFADIRDIAGNFFSAELGVTGYSFELFNMDRGINIVFHQFLGDHDRILEVVTAPRHQGHQHVTTQSQFTQISRRAIGDNVALGYDFTGFDQRTLVKAGVLVGAAIFEQTIDIDARFTFNLLIIADLDHDTFAVNTLNNTTTTGNLGYTRVTRQRRFHAGTDQRFLALQQWYCLTHHVRAHQCAVRIIVLEERNKTGTDGNHL